MTSAETTAESAPASPPEQALPRPRIRHHVVLLAVCSMAIGGAFVLGINKTDHISAPWLNIPLPSVCQFRNVTGLDCPGCGLTRAFVSIAHGRIAEAWQYNAASLLVFAFVLLQIPYRLIQIWRIRSGHRELYMPRTMNAILLIVAGAIFLQWVVKLVGYVVF
mgnify:CR=1 FL=1